MILCAFLEKMTEQSRHEKTYHTYVSFGCPTKSEDDSTRNTHPLFLCSVLAQFVLPQKGGIALLSAISIKPALIKWSESRELLFEFTVEFEVENGGKRGALSRSSPSHRMALFGLLLMAALLSQGESRRRDGRDMSPPTAPLLSKFSSSSTGRRHLLQGNNNNKDNNNNNNHNNNNNNNHDNNNNNNNNNNRDDNNNNNNDNNNKDDMGQDNNNNNNNNRDRDQDDDDSTITDQINEAKKNYIPEDFNWSKSPDDEASSSVTVAVAVVAGGLGLGFILLIALHRRRRNEMELLTSAPKQQEVQGEYLAPQIYHDAATYDGIN
eukprot:g48764.t1